MKTILSLLIFLTTASLYAQDSSRLNISQKKNQADKEFIRKATLGGIAEIQYGELAQRLGSTEAHRNYGKMLSEHHKKANDELKNLVQGQDYPALPTDISGEYQTNYVRLSRLSGTEFDAAFREQMIKDHEETIRLFRDQAERGSHLEIRAWARKTLPTLERHLLDAQKLGSNN
jgi:putative membrane protein